MLKHVNTTKIPNSKVVLKQEKSKEKLAYHLEAVVKLWKLEIKGEEFSIYPAFTVGTTFHSNLIAQLGRESSLTE